MQRILFAPFLVLGCMTTHGWADEPAKDEKKMEVLPPPTPVKPQLLLYYQTRSVPRPETREVWQYYGVDNRGRWLPRVILSPSGAYYYYNGAPFRYTTTDPHLYMPYATD